MYLKQINIENYGSIKNFKHEMKFDENGNPIPIILIGENGSGKSLVLANIVDALIEIKRKIYPGFIPEVKNNNYYKVGKITYINNKAEFSNVNILFSHKDKKIMYRDIMSRNPKQTLENYRQIKEIIGTNKKFIDNGFYKETNGKITEKDFENDIYIYFPVDRYYVPNWFNDENYSKITIKEDERFVGGNTQNIIKNDVLQNIKKWVHEVFLSRDIILVNVEGTNRLVPVMMPLHNEIVNILKIIKNDNTITIPNYTYKNTKLPISGDLMNVDDINNISSGEAMLTSIFLSLIKEYDFNHEKFNLQQISGICIIDEIDLNLHIKQQKDILPKLIKMFPKVQFIITTHSPFFIKGMQDVFDDKCEFLSMPEGNILNNIIEFSEIEKTIEMFNINGDKYIDYTKDLKNQLKRISEEADKITVLTEGKTDALFIKKSYEKLGIEMPNIEIRGLEDKTDGASGDLALKKILSIEKSLKNNKLIAIFDRDNSEILKFLHTETSDELTVVDKKVYAFALPIPKSRNENDKISIEHYFTDKELMTEDINGHRLYLAKEFDVNGINSDKTKICKYLVYNRDKVDDIYVLSGSDDKKVLDLNNKQNVSLTKAEFCNYVCRDVDNFNNFDFNNFKIIIDKINKLVSMIK